MQHRIYMRFPNHLRTVMFFDDVLSCSIITHKLVGFLGIKGREVVQWMEVVGRDSGFALVGSHKDIPQAGIQYTQEAKQLCSAIFSKKMDGGKTCNLVRSVPRI